ncbi:MAG: hypothetical protein ACK5V3_03280, partial [Bdellovibrionales bacterium]
QSLSCFKSAMGAMINSIVRGVIVLLVTTQTSTAWAFFNLGQDSDLTNEESTQIVKILETFSNGCSLTRGPSADAITVVRGLSSALRSAESNPNCKSLAGVVTSLDSTTLRAQSLIPTVNDSYINELESEVTALERQKEEITKLLSQTTDPTEISDLRRQLYSVKIELAGTLSQARDSALNDKQMRKAQAMRLLLGSTQQAVNQIIANEACWINQPSLLQQVAGVGATLGASASLTTVASETAVLLSAGMGILSTIVDFFERLATAKKLAQFDLALGSTAITCAMEKMNDVYCSAQDTLNAIEKIGSRFHDNKQDPVWSGVELLEKQIPTLLSWLQKLKSGGGAGTVSDAVKQAEIELQEVNLLNSSRIFEGFYRDSKLRFDQTSGEDAKFLIVRGLAGGFFYSLCSSNNGQPNMNNPFCTEDFGFAPYELVGLTKNEQLTLQSRYNGFNFFNLTLETLRSVGIEREFNLVTVQSQFQKMYSRIREKFDIEKRLVLGQDLTLIFDEGLDRGFQIANPVSAESSLKDLLKFFKSSPTDRQDKVQLDLRDQVIQTLSLIIEQLELVKKKEVKPETAKEVIYQSAELKFGTSYLGDRLDRVVRMELEALVRNPNYVDEPTRLTLLAANDVISELRRYYQVSSLQEMEEAAANAQLVMIKTIDPFIRLFSSPMIRVFNEFDSIESRVGGAGARQARALKTKLCYYFLNSTRPLKFFNDECEGLKAQSVLGVEAPAYDRKMFQQPLETRACLYRNFIMKNRIKEKRKVQKSFIEMLQVETI